MTPAATLSAVSWQTNRLAEFLREALVPTPYRWHQTLRVTVACVAASWVVMAFHLKLPLIVMILMFLITREDTTSTLLTTVAGILGVTVGSGVLMLTYVCAVDIPWLRVLLVPTFVALGLFLNRVVTLGPIGSALAVPLGLGLVVPDIIPSTEYLTRFPFYFWWAAVLGLLVSLAVQYLSNPKRVQSILVGGLASRLEAVEAALLRLAGDERQLPPPVALVSLALEGAARQLPMLKLASLAEPWLKQRQAELSAEIILVDRLVTAAWALEQQGVQNLSEATQQRLRRMAHAAAAWREAVLENRWPELPQFPEGEDSDDVALPALSEMERVLELAARAKAKELLPDELKVPPGALGGGLILGDAFRNPDYVRFAVKGALAAFICYLIFTLTDYQNIYTSVVTCVVCSLSTIGASVQKGVLRFAGSAVGGVLGVFTVMYIFPHLDSIGGFWIPFAAVTALAAYITFGSPAISYGGYQIGLAFYKCTLQDYGPYTELRVVRDRLIGILLGLTVFGIINSRLWPLKALDTAQAKLAAALHTLAKLAGLPDEPSDPRPRLLEAYALRLRAYQDFGTVHQLLAGAKFEPGEAARRKLEELSMTAQALFVYLLAIIQHRPDLRPEAMPEPLRAAAARFRATLAAVIDSLGDRISGQATQLPDLQGALTELEGIVAAQIHTIMNAHVAAHISARLALYRRAVPLALQLERLQVE